jgi:hypothetical protein
MYGTVRKGDTCDPVRTSSSSSVTASHTDRQVATTLQAVLKRYGASSYLDQDQIQAGDVLPQQIKKAIANCDTLLLLWSSRLSRSACVRREWQTSLKMRKKIVPYALDTTPLPREFEDRVFVEPGDQTHVGEIRGSDLEGRLWTLSRSMEGRPPPGTSEQSPFTHDPSD